MICLGCAGAIATGAANKVGKRNNIQNHRTMTHAYSYWA